MKLKKDADSTDFLKETKKCKGEVYYETKDGNRLNLKSVLSQYVFAVLSQRDELSETGEIVCSAEDMQRLEKYLEE